MELNTKNIVLILVLALALVGTTVLVTTYAVNYFSSAQEKSGTATPGVARSGSPGVNSERDDGFAPLPTSSPDSSLSFEECRSASGTKNLKYDLNNDGLVTPLDCAQLN